MALSLLPDLLDEYQFLDADDRYRMLIDLGRTLEPMPDALKSDATLVRGCSASVWVYPTKARDSLHFLADSNAAITKGIRPRTITFISQIFVAYRKLPMLCPRRTFDLPVQIGCDPAAIKITRLRDDAQIADPSLVHQPGVKRHMARKCRKASGWPVIGPGRARGGFITGQHVIIARHALPFAIAAALNRAQDGRDILGGQVVSGRVVRFQYPKGTAGVGH